MAADIYFCFSDECGDYHSEMTERQIRQHPFYIRATMLLNAGEWKGLNAKFRELKVKYELPITKELKWANLWTIRKFQNNGKAIPTKFDLSEYENIDYHHLIDFVEESLSLISTIDEVRVVITYTKNKSDNRFTETQLLSYHLQEHMQRIEMALQHDVSNLGVLFIDPVSSKKNKILRDIYNNLYENGDFINRYSFIKDSLNIENSHQSVGIQLADFIAGSFSACLKANDENNYNRGIKMFLDSVYPKLRKYRNSVHGAGIREVPSNALIRQNMKDKIEWCKGVIAE